MSEIHWGRWIGGALVAALAVTAFSAVKIDSEDEFGDLKFPRVAGVQPWVNEFLHSGDDATTENQPQLPYADVAAARRVVGTIRNANVQLCPTDNSYVEWLEIAGTGQKVKICLAAHLASIRGNEQKYSVAFPLTVSFTGSSGFNLAHACNEIPSEISERIRLKYEEYANISMQRYSGDATASYPTSVYAIDGISKCDTVNASSGSGGGSGNSNRGPS